MKTAGPLLATVGVGMVGVAGLMQTEQLPRNQLVGMRTGATLASDAAWIASHRASAWSVAVAGLLLLGLGAWLMRSRRSERTNRHVGLAASLAVIAVVIVGGIQADRVAQDTIASSG